MALQVWLPLNGDTRQQGLSNITVTGSPNAWNNGKIGKCAYWNGAVANVIYNNTTDFNYTNNFSVAFWANPVFTGSTTQYAWTVGRADAGGYGYGFQIINNTTASFRFGNGSYGVSAPSNEWHHYTMTIGNSKIIIYKDGIQISSNNLPGTLPTYSDGNGIGLGCFHYSSNIYPYYGSLNDFRIYNHCLSQMEVKELAKGLVLHYPLNRQGWGQENLLPINGSTIINSTNSFEFQGWVQNFYTKTWMNEHLTPGKQYTLSYTVTCLSIPGSTYTFKENRHSPILVHQGSGWSQVTTTSDGVKDTNMSVGQSRHYQCTFTFATASESYEYYGLCGYTALYRDASNNVQYARFRIDGLKLEEGSIATPWCPNSSDELATTLGLNETTEYDCSGYCNNSMRVGTFTWISDTPKYQVSQQFNGSNNHIYLNNFHINNMFSIACWVRCANSSSTYFIFQCGTSGSYTSTQFGIHSSGDGNAYGIIVNKQYVKVSNLSSLTDWHHMVLTFDGTTEKFYFNGILKNTVTITNEPYNGTKLSLGSYFNSGNVSLNGGLSDFRIYATALSADDVKSLYQNSAYIDSSGNVYGAIHSEV